MLFNDAFVSNRIENCKCLLDPLKYKGAYIKTRAEMVCSLATTPPLVEFNLTKQSDIDTNNESSSIRKKLAIHFAHLGLQRLHDC